MRSVREGLPRGHGGTGVPPFRPGRVTAVWFLVALSLMALLALLAAGLAWFRAGDAVSDARRQLESMERGLARYKAQAGDYPAAADPSGRLVYVLLWGDGVGPDGVFGTADDTAPNGRTDEGAVAHLAELDPAENPLKLVEPSGMGAIPTRLVDPWGGSWHYRSGSHSNQNSDFDLWSAGPDREEGTADDIRNW